MTTIATDGISIAADGRFTGAGYIITDDGMKLFKHKDVIYGMAGDMKSIERFKRYLKDRDGILTIDDDDDFEALALHPDGHIERWDKDLEPVVYAAPWAIGTGDEIAIGAMEMGAAPASAVHCAIRRDTRSGGTVTELFRHGWLRE